MERLIKSFGAMILTVFLAVSFIFLVIRLAPGDPVERILGPQASREEIEKYRNQLGLDLPLYQQYLNYLGSLIQGDLGTSLFRNEKVVKLINDYFKPSLILAFISVSLSTLIGLIAGIISAKWHTGFPDKFVRITTLAGLSMPIFSLAPLLIYLFAIYLGLLPVSEWGLDEHMFLPILTLVIPLSAIVTRVTRTRYLEEQVNPWVRVLEAKGLSPYSIVLRVAKNILPSVFNVVAIQLSVVLAGTIVTETIYDIPGMGLLLFEGIQGRDYPVVQGVIVYITVIYMLVYFLVDMVNSVIDPRIVE